MKKLLFKIVILLLAASVSYSKDQPLQRLDKGSSLALTIKSDKQVYEVGEEIKLEVVFENKSEKEMVVSWRDKTSFILSEEIGVYIAVMYIPPADEISYIKPQESITKTVSLALDKSMKPLQGKLRIQFSYNNQSSISGFEHRVDQEIWQGVLTSNTITIEVKEKK